jgi:predicted transcriptional regulator of viral defense system
MTYRNAQAARKMLSDLATTQGGYFTANQAAVTSYGRRHLDYHVKAGNFERIGRGLFRQPAIPPSEHDDLIRLSLWSRDRGEHPQVVVSHVTALAFHGLPPRPA